MTYRKTMVLLLGTVAAASLAGATPKEEAVAGLRESFSRRTPYIAGNLRSKTPEFLKLLDDNGSFRDLSELERKYRANGWGNPKYDYTEIQVPVLNMLVEAFNRLQVIALDLRDGRIPAADRSVVAEKLRKAVLNYAAIEFDRGNRITVGRFHGSCFAIPGAASGIYFALYNDMVSGKYPEVADALKKLAFQAWSQPVRRDATDRNIVSVDRFRKHVWWVGGNATAYRPLLEAALVNSSPEMIDVLSKVAAGSISQVSQNTYDKAFWIEGFTADGAGWGHGRQCLIWGYPIHGTNGSLNILSKLAGTPWGASLDANAIETIFDFFRGSAFYFYKGTIPPVLERGNARPDYAKKREIPSMTLVENLLRSFRHYLNPMQIAELEQFRREAKAKNLFMLNYPAGNYHGTRYFFNNDDLIRKTPEYYAFVNMASRRTNGLESYFDGANGFNLFTCDGQTLFEREGGESAKALGSAVLTMLPGTTARQVKKLNPVQNWIGYGSQGRFAAGAAAPDGDAVAGFIFDKVNDSVVERPSRHEENPEILKLRANKGYFFFGDLFCALGAGIENLAPEYEGSIFTTVEQTLAKNAVKPVTAHGIDWHGNNGFLYGVLPSATTGKIHSKHEVRRTNWRGLSQANAGAVETEQEMFSLWIDHGREVKNGTYAYFVACGGKVPEKLPSILANTVQVQAMELGQTVQALFYDAGTQVNTSMGKLSVSAPCALILKREDGSVSVTAADGLMNRNLGRLDISLGAKQFSLSLPSGEALGKAVTRKFLFE